MEESGLSRVLFPPVEDDDLVPCIPIPRRSRRVALTNDDDDDDDSPPTNAMLMSPPCMARAAAPPLDSLAVLSLRDRRITAPFRDKTMGGGPVILPSRTCSLADRKAAAARFREREAKRATTKNIRNVGSNIGDTLGNLSAAGLNTAGVHNDVSEKVKKSSNDGDCAILTDITNKTSQYSSNKADGTKGYRFRSSKCPLWRKGPKPRAEPTELRKGAAKRNRSHRKVLGSSDFFQGEKVVVPPSNGPIDLTSPISSQRPKKKLAKKKTPYRKEIKPRNETSTDKYALPLTLEGVRVAKSFKRTIYFGTVEEVFIHDKTGEQNYFVKYDDEDQEVLNRKDLAQGILLYVLYFYVLRSLL